MKKLILTLLTIFLVLPLWATSYERRLARMNDHFDHAEWSEVLQETEMMIQTQPGDVEPYAAALIAAQFLEDIPTENRYIKQSQSNRVHIDSLLQCVYVRTRLLHNAQVYEQLLLNLKANNRWLTRVFNIYLLDFYDFARKTEQTIIIADELLQVTPDNKRFKKIKANALFYQGDSKEAVDLYEDILQQDSTDYETLTFLAAYYIAEDMTMLNDIDNAYLQDKHPTDSVYKAHKQHIIDTRIARSLTLLHKAQEMRPSDHLTNEIERLSNITNQLPPRHEKRKASKKASKE